MLLSVASQVKVKVELKPVVDNFIFRLHYRYTYGLFLLGALLSTLYEAIGDKINCMTSVDSDAFNDVVNNYCFIMGTFTIDRLHGLEVGKQVPHPGVGPPEPNDSITYHSYYQWVPFVLFLQAVVFYLPHWLWKQAEGGYFKDIIKNLSVKDYLGTNLSNYIKKEERIETLATYVAQTMHQRRSWAYRFFFCELLNLGVVLATLFFTDWFLGGEFLSYGANVFSVASLDPENRTDPMSYVFPRMAKCTFRSFGASGTIQVSDMLCLIATNIINEKIYLFLWVWLVVLTALTCAWMLYRILTLLLPPIRTYVLKVRVVPSVRDHVNAIMRRASISEWFLLVNLSRNMEQSVFSEFIRVFAFEESRSPSPVDFSPDGDFEKLPMTL